MALQVRDFAGIDLKSRLDPFALAKSINIRVVYISDLVGLAESSRARLDVPDGWSGGATQDLGDGSYLVSSIKSTVQVAWPPLSWRKFAIFFSAIRLLGSLLIGLVAEATTSKLRRRRTRSERRRWS